MSINREALLAQIKQEERELNERVARSLLGEEFQTYGEPLTQALERVAEPLRIRYVEDLEKEITAFFKEGEAIEINFLTQIHNHNIAMINEYTEQSSKIRGATFAEFEYHASLTKPEDEVMSRITNLFEDSDARRAALQASIDQRNNEETKRLISKREKEEQDLKARYGKKITDLVEEHMTEYKKLALPVFQEFIS